MVRRNYLHTAGLGLLLLACGDDMTITLHADSYDASATPVYLWAGQSNAKELGDTANLTGGDVDYADPLAAVRYALKGYGSPGDESPTTRAWASLQCYADAIGMEMSFGHNLPGDGAVLKFSIGSSNLAHWISAARDDEMVAYFEAQLAIIGQPYYPAGFVWIQGESESSASSLLWGGRFDVIVGKVRALAGRRRLPVYVVETQDPNGNDMSAAQHAWVASDPHAAIIETPAYEASPHWQVPSICRIGEDIATAVATPP